MWWTSSNFPHSRVFRDVVLKIKRIKKIYIYLLKVFVDLQLSQGQKHQGLIHSESLKSTLNLSKDIKATTTAGTHSHILWNKNIWPSQQKAALVSQEITSHVCVDRYLRSLISNVIQGWGGDPADSAMEAKPPASFGAPFLHDVFFLWLEIIQMERCRKMKSSL